MSQIRIGAETVPVPAHINSYAEGVAWLRQSAQAPVEGEKPADFEARSARFNDLAAKAEALIEAAKKPAEPAPAAVKTKGVK